MLEPTLRLLIAHLLVHPRSEQGEGIALQVEAQD